MGLKSVFEVAVPCRYSHPTETCFNLAHFNHDSSKKESLTFYVFVISHLGQQITASILQRKSNFESNCILQHVEYKSEERGQNGTVGSGLGNSDSNEKGGISEYCIFSTPSNYNIPLVYLKIHTKDFNPMTRYLFQSKTMYFSSFSTSCVSSRVSHSFKNIS